MRRTKAIVAVAIVAVGAGSLLLVRAPGDTALTPQLPITLTFDTDTASATFGSVSVIGLGAEALRAVERADLSREQWEALLSIKTVQDPSTPPVMGVYAVTDAALRFTPRFPPVASVAYNVRFDPQHLPGRRGLSLRDIPAIGDTFTLMPTPALPSTRVVAVYPSADRVPMNLLKMYIHFSAPMRLGDAYDQIHLVDDAGEEVDDAFLVVREELWDQDQRRFTLFFDPGRIKQDLRPREQLGLPLIQGRTYRLIIGSQWRDANGNPLIESFERRFIVDAQDRSSIDPESWQVTVPPVGTTEPVRLAFPESLDRALLERMISVHDSMGRSLSGTVNVTSSETHWAFGPSEAWRAGRYNIMIDSDLEDLAGNTLIRLFDAPHEEPSSDDRQVFQLPFDISR